MGTAVTTGADSQCGTGEAQLPPLRRGVVRAPRPEVSVGTEFFSAKAGDTFTAFLRRNSGCCFFHGPSGLDTVRIARDTALISDDACARRR
jgi:hypothetical protein